MEKETRLAARTRRARADRQGSWGRQFVVGGRGGGGSEKEKGQSPRKTNRTLPVSTSSATGPRESKQGMSRSDLAPLG